MVRTRCSGKGPCQGSGGGVERPITTSVDKLCHDVDVMLGL